MSSAIRKTLKQRLAEIRRSDEYIGTFAAAQFTEQLAKKLNEKNVSQRELAERLGKSEAYISRVLSGNENVTVKTMSVLAAALGQSVHIFLAPKGVSVAIHEYDAKRFNAYQAGNAFSFGPDPSSSKGEALTGYREERVL